MLWFFLAERKKNDFFLKIILIYSWETHREREAETQAEGETGSVQGAQRGTRSQISRIRPWAEGGAKPLSHWGCPKNWFLYKSCHSPFLISNNTLDSMLLQFSSMEFTVGTCYHLTIKEYLFEKISHIQEEILD